MHLERIMTQYGYDNKSCSSLWLLEKEVKNYSKVPVELNKLINKFLIPCMEDALRSDVEVVLFLFCFLVVSSK